MCFFAVLLFANGATFMLSHKWFKSLIFHLIVIWSRNKMTIFQIYLL